MGMIIELWTEEDDERLRRFHAAANDDRLEELLGYLDRPSPLQPRLAELVERSAAAAADAASFAGALGLASAIARELLDHAELEHQPDADPSAEGDLSRLVENKGGSHRTLAALWASVCWRADYDAYWLEMEHFFPVCILEEGRPLLIDPASGAMLTRADCREIVGELRDDSLPFDEELFTRPHARLVADQILAQRLEGAAVQGNDVSLYQALRLRAALFPDDERMQLNTALAAVRVGDLVWAQHTLRELLQRSEDPELRRLIEENLERLREMRAEFN